MNAATTTDGRANSPRTRLTRHEKLVLIVLMGATFMLSIDFSVLNVALPQIGREVGFSLGSLQWIISAFALPAAGFGLMLGRLGDLMGRKKMFLIGLTLLAIGSLTGGIATTPTVLIIGRVVQGVGFAAVAPAALSLLTTSFSEGPLRDRALALNGALLSAGFTLGALLGGVLTSGISWRAAFFINVPIAIILIVAAIPLLTDVRAENRPTLDIPGALTCSAGLLALIYGLTEAGQHGFGAPAAWGAIVVAILSILACLLIESRTRQPLIAVSVLRRGNVAFGNLAGLSTFTLMSSLTYLLTLYLEDVLRFQAVLSGMVISVIGIVAIGGANVVPKLLGRYGQKAVVVGALMLQGIGTITLSFVGAGSIWVTLAIAAIIVAAFGHIGTIIGYTVTATSGLPNHEQGVATGLTTTSQQIGLALGTPIMAAIVTATSGHLNLLHGISTALLINGGAAIVVSLIVLWRLPGRATTTQPATVITETADETAA